MSNDIFVINHNIIKSLIFVSIDEIHYFILYHCVTARAFISISTAATKGFFLLPFFRKVMYNRLVKCAFLVKLFLFYDQMQIYIYVYKMVIIKNCLT